MASYRGFFVIDDSGREQVVDKAYDLTLSQTTSINTVSKDNALFYDKVIALEPTSSQKIGVGWYYNPPSGSDNGNPDGIQPVRGVGKVHSFKFGSSINTGNFGLEVYDSNGVATFSTSARSIDIIDVIYIPDWNAAMSNNGNNIVFSRSYPSKKVAVILAGVPSKPVAGSSGIANLATIGFHKSGDLLVGSLFVSAEGLPNAGAPTWDKKDALFLVIDATNFER